MFHNIPQEILDRMQQLEKMDAEDRQDGTPRFERLRQITPETGKFIALLASLAPDGEYLEIGTSAGYSALWLSLACRHKNRTITTIELSEDKAILASESFKIAAVEKEIKLVIGDARECVLNYDSIAFCFLDAEKEIYEELYKIVVPKMIEGGILVADNAISHQETLQQMIDLALADTRVDSLVVPIGRGELVCRKL
jgi:caffeoyl-CoA O-methyltransferase